MHQLSELPADHKRVLLLSKGRQRVLEAYRRGYRVDGEGEVISPSTGKRLKATADTGHRSPRRRFNLRMSKKRGDSYGVKVHQLSAYQMLGDEMIVSELLVCHKDEDELNNRMDNLYLGTHSSNMMDQPEAVRIARAKHAAKAQRRLTEEQVVELRQDSTDGMSNVALMAKYKIAAGTVSGIVNYRTYR